MVLGISWGICCLLHCVYDVTYDGFMKCPDSFTLALSAAIEKPERVTIPVSVDTTQEEALSVLKKLKVGY